MLRMFFCCSHASMSHRGSLPPTGPWLERLLSHRGFTFAKQRERVSAFTLVELLIATGITVAMVLMLGLMLGALMSSASHATERVDAFRDARAALQMMERDLRNLVALPASTPTPAPTPPVAAAYFAAANRYSDPAGNNPATGNRQLYALVAVKPTASPPPFLGDVCAVGYYCRWDDQLHAYTLRRFFRNSADTFTVIQRAGTYAADSVLYAPGTSDAVMAAYVWNFRITMYDSGGAVINYPYICDPDPTTPKVLPAAIEISFNAMSPQAARTLMSVSSSPNDWMDTTTQNYQRLILPHAYQFRSRINLP
jgi:type II secretory pathway pseudopilin PulG